MIATKAFRLGLCAALLAAVACGDDDRTVIVAVSPSSVSLEVGATQQFTASVVGTSVTDVTWSISEGASGGAVTSAGLYTAPAATGVFHVVATSLADTTKSASAAVTVLMPSPVQTITTTPQVASLKTNATFQFTAVINGNTSTAVTWSVAAGGAGGTISATGLYTSPSVTGRDAVIATATADPTRSATSSVTVTLSPAPILNYISNKLTCTVGTPCSLAAPSNSGGPYLSLAVAPALPAGLSLDTNTGAISGTPTAVAASATYGVLATNAGGTGTTPLIITVNAVVPSALSYGSNFIICTVNVACPAVLPTNAGGAATGFSITPALPAGLTINASTGAISGTPTVVTASSAYVVTATNSGGTTSAAINVSVIDSPPTAVTYSSTSLTCTIGVACGLAAPTVAGGAVTSYAVSPNLPDGLVLDPSSGAISGTPDVIVAGSLYVVLASNSGGTVIVDLEIAVDDLPPTGLTYTNNTIACTKGTPCALPAPTHGGGTVTNFSVSPALPDGLIIDANSGAVTGTPTVVSAQAPYVVTASNSGGSSTATIKITVNDTAPTALVYSPSTGSCTETEFCSFGPPTNSGGKVTAYSVTPALPAGLNLSPTTGLITGTALGVSPATNYVVKAANSGGSTTETINFTVLEAAPRSLTYSPDALVCSQNVACSLGAPHNDGGQIDTYAISPALPAGLAINGTSGAITGTPTAVSAAATYTVTGTNSIGNTTATVTVTVNGPPPPPPANLVYSPASLTCQINVACALAAPTQSGGAVTSYTISPALPAGLSIDAGTGAISGTPTATSAAASYTVTAANAGGSTTATLSIVVNAAGPWTALGPLGGEVIQLAISPDSNTLFAVTSDGGIYRSLDAGGHWAFSAVGIVYQGANAVAFDPTTAGSLYASTPSSGYAVSADNGNTWSLVGPFDPETNANTVQGVSIAADPFTAGTFYGGATQSGTVIWKSTDRGNTINASQSGIAESPFAAVYPDPVTQGLLYAVTGAHVYKSTDSGANWAESDANIPSSDTSLVALAIDPVVPANLYVVSSTAGVVYFSRDAGVSWTTGSAGLPQTASTLFPQGIFVDPSLHTRIFLSSPNGNYVSADSGVDWAAYSVTPSSAAIVGVAPNGNVYASDLSGLYKTVNGGGVWNAANTGLTATEMYSVAVASNGNLYATGNNGTFTSTNGGTTWTLLASAPLGRQIAVDPVAPAKLVLIGLDSTVSTSQDSGATWTQSPSTSGFTSLTLVPAGTTIYAATLFSGVQVSHDDGQTWASSGTINVIQPERVVANVIKDEQPVINSVAVLGTDSTKLLAITNTAAYYSADSGATWAQSSVPVQEGDTLRVAASAGSSGIFFVAGDQVVYSSSDGGQTFGDFALLNGPGATIATRVLVVNPTTGELYVDVNDDFISVSADGQTVTGLTTGLTSYAVYQVVSTGSLLYAATLGGGVLVSSTDGVVPLTPAVARAR